MTTDRWGIDTHWIDAYDRPQTVSASTLTQLRALIGEPPRDLEQLAPVVTRPGGSLATVRLPAEVECEDGSTRPLDGHRLPGGFPLGYHWLRDSDGQRRRLIVSPGRCYLPEGWRAWGLAVQLYAARSARSWGIGDLADLRSLRHWVADLGGGFLMVNPLLAVSPTLPQEASPYLPASRRWRNPVYLCIDEVPGAAGAVTADEQVQARELRRLEHVERDQVWALKRTVLERIFDVRGDTHGFDVWRDQQGVALQEFATWCALADRHGPDWRAWPASLHRPDEVAVLQFAQEHDRDVAFHAWLQWLLVGQLGWATGDLTVIQDLPIGVAGGGVDAWVWQDQVAAGVEVGAPPDFFNSAGQAWGSPPFIPWQLRAADYEPFIQSVRGSITGAGGLRIDHVMGLFRLWWVPPGGSPVEGAYVRSASADLLNIVALESHRARAIVVGEDLGTVEPGVRETLADQGLLSYRLLWFESADPATWTPGGMAAVTTHDLPTVAGLWTGLDLAEQQRYAVNPDDDELVRGRRQLLDNVTGPAGLAADASVSEAVVGVHRLLARAPSMLVTATLEDAVAQRQRPNLPGTTERANWSLPLPVLVEDLPTHPLVTAVTNVLAEAIARRVREDDSA